MKQIWASILAAGLVLVALALPGCQKKETPDQTVYFFFEGVCESCDLGGNYRLTAEKKLAGLELPEGYSLRCLNAFKKEEAQWDALCDQWEIPEERRTLPMLITPAGWVTGNDATENQLRHLVCESYGLDDSRTYWYYYRPECPDCDAIKSQLSLAFQLRPELSLIRTDTTDPEPKAAFKALLTEMDVPDEEWQVPFLIGSSGYLSGDKEIAEKLDEFLDESR